MPCFAAEVGFRPVARAESRLHAVQGGEDEGAAGPGQVRGLLRLQRRRLRRQTADLLAGCRQRLQTSGSFALRI